jgi:hypothetical protein
MHIVNIFNLPVISINSTDLVFNPKTEIEERGHTILRGNDFSTKVDTFPPPAAKTSPELAPQHHEREAKAKCSSDWKVDEHLDPMTVSRKEFYQGHHPPARLQVKRKKKRVEQTRRVTDAVCTSSYRSYGVDDVIPSFSVTPEGVDNSLRPCRTEELAEENASNSDKSKDELDNGGPDDTNFMSGNSVATSGMSNSSQISSRADGLYPTEYSFLQRKRRLRPYLAWAHIVDYAPHFLPHDGHLHVDMAKQRIKPRKRASRVVTVKQGEMSPLHSFFATLFNAPDEAFDCGGFLRKSWLHEARPALFTRRGHVQEFVIRKRRPLGISQDFWSWLVGTAIPSTSSESKIRESLELRWTKEMLKEVEQTYDAGSNPRDTEKPVVTTSESSACSAEGLSKSMSTAPQPETLDLQSSAPDLRLLENNDGIGGEGKRESWSHVNSWLLAIPGEYDVDMKDVLSKPTMSYNITFGSQSDH